jgi:hypothetical protein
MCKKLSSLPFSDEDAKFAVPFTLFVKVVSDQLVDINILRKGEHIALQEVLDESNPKTEIKEHLSQRIDT